MAVSEVFVPFWQSHRATFEVPGAVERPSPVYVLPTKTLTQYGDPLPLGFGLYPGAFASGGELKQMSGSVGIFVSSSDAYERGGVNVIQGELRTAKVYNPFGPMFADDGVIIAEQSSPEHKAIFSDAGVLSAEVTHASFSGLVMRWFVHAFEKDGTTTLRDIIQALPKGDVIVRFDVLFAPANGGEYTYEIYVPNAQRAVSVANQTGYLLGAADEFSWSVYGGVAGVRLEALSTYLSTDSGGSWSEVSEVSFELALSCASQTMGI